MNRFVEDLLLLAKAESPDFLQLETVPLGVLADELVAKARAMADRDWRVDAATPRSVVVDRQRITQAVMSLAQNAVAHTARRGRDRDRDRGQRRRGGDLGPRHRDRDPRGGATADLLALRPRLPTAAVATRAPASGWRSSGRSPRLTVDGSG